MDWGEPGIKPQTPLDYQILLLLRDALPAEPQAAWRISWLRLQLVDGLSLSNHLAYIYFLNEPILFQRLPK